VPFDPVTKRTGATVPDSAGKSVVLTKAAPQGIVELANPAADVAPPHGAALVNQPLRPMSA